MLIEEQDVFEEFDAFESVAGAGWNWWGFSGAELFLQCGDECVGDKGAFATATDSGDDAEDSQRNLGIDSLQVMAGGVANPEPVLWRAV